MSQPPISSAPRVATTSPAASGARHSSPSAPGASPPADGQRSPRPSLTTPAPGQRGGLLLTQAAWPEQLNHLCQQMDAVGAPSVNTDAAFQVFDLLHGQRSAIHEALLSHDTDSRYLRFQSRLSRFLRDFGAAVEEGRIELTLVSHLEQLCLGLASCTAHRRSAISRSASTAVQDLSETIQARMHEMFANSAFKSIGQFLDIQAWVIHALQARLITPTAALRSLCQKSFLVVEEWAVAGTDLTAHNLGKLAVQLNMLCDPEFELIDLKAPVQRQRLHAIFAYLYSSHMAQKLLLPAELGALANLCILLRTQLKTNRVRSDDPALPGLLSQLLAPVAKVLPADLLGAARMADQAANGLSLTELANLLRTVLRKKIEQGFNDEQWQQISKVCSQVAEAILSPAFTTAHPSAGYLSNLLAFVRACELTRRHTPAEQRAALPDAATCRQAAAVLLGKPYLEAELLHSRETMGIVSWLNVLAWLHQQQGFIDPATFTLLVKALLEAIAKNGLNWDDRWRHAALGGMAQMLDAGFAMPALQGALKALLGPRLDGQDWSEEDLRRAAATPASPAPALPPQLSLLDPSGHSSSSSTSAGSSSGDGGARHIPGDQPKAPDRAPRFKQASSTQDPAPRLSPRKAEEGDFVPATRTARPQADNLAQILAGSASGAADDTLADDTGNEQDESPQAPDAEQADTGAGGASGGYGLPANRNQRGRLKGRQRKLAKQAADAALDLHPPKPGEYVLPPLSAGHYKPKQAREIARARETATSTYWEEVGSGAQEVLNKRADLLAPPSLPPASTQDILAQLYAARATKMVHVIAKDEVAALKALLDSPDGARLLRHVYPGGMRPLQVAAEFNATQAALALLGYPAVQQDAGLVDDDGHTPLLKAAHNGNAALLAALLAVPAARNTLFYRRALSQEELAAVMKFMAESEKANPQLGPLAGQDMGRSDYDALELVITNEHAACVHQLLALAEVRARLHDPAAMEQVLLLAIHNEVPGLIEDLARFATMHQLLLQPRIAPFFLSAVATRQYVNAGLLLIHSDARRLLRQVDIEGRNAFDIARNDQPMLDLLRRAWNALDRPEEANQDDEEEEDESKSEQ